MMTRSQESLAASLLEIGAIRFGAFRLKLHDTQPSAPLSPIYVDLRLLRSFPRAMRLALDVYSELAASLSFDCYADVPTAATPLVGALAFLNQVPMISPRLDKKAHGTGTAIDGCFQPGTVALVIDDLITRADSKLQAIHVLETNGLRVRDIIVLVDREQGGMDELKQRGYVGHAALKLSALLNYYSEKHSISEEDYRRTVQYLGTAGR